MKNDDVSKLELTNRGLTNLIEHLKEVVPMIESAANNFRVKGEVESNKYYIECIDALRLFSELIDGVGKLLQMDYSTIALKDGNLSQKIKSTGNIFDSMHQAQQRQDWVTLSDLLDYELSPMMKEWIEILPGVREQLSAQAE